MTESPMLSKNASVSRAFFDEIKKVSWPSRQETMRLTSIVIMVSIVVGVYVGVIDLGLTQALGILTK